MFDITGLDRLPFLPEKGGYSYDRGSNLAVADFDGQTLSREATEHDIHIAKATWHLTDDEYDYFQAFYHLTLDKGSLPFLLEMIGENPDNTDYVVKFISDSMVMSEPTSNTFIVKASLEIYPNDPDDYQSALVLIYEDETEFYAILNQLNIFVNVDCEIL